MRLSCNFVNVYMIAYHVHVYTRAYLIHSPNPNPDSSNRISPKWVILEPLFQADLLAGILRKVCLRTALVIPTKRPNQSICHTFVGPTRTESWNHVLEWGIRMDATWKIRLNDSRSAMMRAVATIGVGTKKYM